MDYYRPATLKQALAIRANSHVRILAGGTDFYPALQDRPVIDPVLDISKVEELRQIRAENEGWEIGANATWTDIQLAILPPAFDALKQAAHEVGSVQIQNRGTIVGNICNASPAADGVPPLLILDASVVIASHLGTRTQPLADFIRGNRQTTLAPDELVTAIHIPKLSAVGTSNFIKLGARKYLVISIAMAAVRIVSDGNTIINAAVAVGSCSAVAQRMSRLESRLVGFSLNNINKLDGISESIDELSPIDDIRSPAIYRRHAAVQLVRSAVATAAGRPA